MALELVYGVREQRNRFRSGLRGSFWVLSGPGLEPVSFKRGPGANFGHSPAPNTGWLQVPPLKPIKTPLKPINMY